MLGKLRKSMNTLTISKLLEYVMGQLASSLLLLATALGQRKMISLKERDALLHTGLLSDSREVMPLRTLGQWKKAEQLFIQGDFEASVVARRLILQRCKEMNSSKLLTSSPIGLSHEFTTNNIGHLAILVSLTKCQNLGLIESGKRLLPLKHSQLSNPLVSHILPHVTPMISRSGLGWVDLPNSWHLFDRLSMPWTLQGYDDQYQLVDRLFSETVPDQNSPFLSLDAQYEEITLEQLCTLGLPAGAEFVALHIRNDSTRNTRRNQPISSFRDAVMEIASAGLWTIRIGDATMEPLGDLPNFIDLTRFQDACQRTHLYVLARALFLLGTASGPSHFAPNLGTPTLVTNTTSIGRNTLASSKGSIYMPKMVFSHDLNRLLTMEETLESKEGYGELDSRDLLKLGLELIPNTGEMIKSATQEMLAYTVHSQVRSKKFDEVVSDIRRGRFFASSGNFSEAFLSAHEWWLESQT